VRLVGILDDGWSGLAESARAALADAALVLGAGRTLELVRRELPRAELRAMDGMLLRLPGWIDTALAEGRQVAVLATGDPLCHGIAGHLIGKLGAARVRVLPAPSTLQLAFARWQKPWHDAAIASCHSKDAGEWQPGATPEHGLYPLLRAVALNRRVAAFMSPQNDPARLARALLAAGYADAKLSVACRLLLSDEAVHADLAVAEVVGMSFPEPCVVLVERDADEALPTFGFADDEYVQRAPEKGLITKQEARALSLAKLRLRPDAVIWDIGAATGSVGLECARLAPHGHVWAIEKNPGDAANARANAARLRATNYTLVEGRAPAGLDAWPDPDAVFIGGSGGELAALIQLCLARLRPGGRLVMNFVTLENLATATAALKEGGAGANIAWDVVQLQAARSQPILDLHRLAAQNPVWIITASKENP
jgi:precorrin-6B C5,15-methyltransferase / cobalt-precorrin-6B C5,C15-methyltransferase